ncbi:hypothetical protein GNI_016900 [Gregarina niphandrodes]|uniref:Uncharacterized protein n=1 Tax=Gregarina niphandrodes TaxID=110365 RepID=A0A023BC87_GRENI|nr:hypothetical protein GNI_016900 [Gregarina niphandrodes]EZG82235.1 hypothetical protein GNI_016900 [Gregarina niphandrodes]|eukprot:XP_011129016.1 hypothetical protein GNI_016900 [Gregarina niphandrodes]
MDTLLADLASQWPTAEAELEHAYQCLAAPCDGLDHASYECPRCEGFDYEKVEPIIRHFLYSMGLGEYIGKVSDSKSRLRLTEITPLLNAVGVRFDSKKRLNLDDWKILLIAWVRRIQELQHTELQLWHDKLEAMQTEQQKQFQAAIKAFQRSYIQQIHAYHKAVDDHHKQEERYRVEWEASGGLSRQHFLEEQSRYVDKMNANAEANFRQRVVATQQRDAVILLDRETKAIDQEVMPGADKVSAYIYPVNLNDVSGAPISGGARLLNHKGKMGAF